jgi:hypothetical protein
MIVFPSWMGRWIAPNAMVVKDARRLRAVRILPTTCNGESVLIVVIA